MDFTVTLVGAGNMGGAMLRGWLTNGMKPDQIRAIDPSPSQLMVDFLSSEGIECNPSADGLSATDVLLVAV
ncbi:MAG: NAD(P)-binding domain-containing protein, partial [Rhizobiaceae bacterium]|nr:NAD(P)-binding domain-containing protein [Rhizobiaceae bacterium]